MKRKFLNIALIALLPFVFSCSEDRLDLEPEIGQIFTGDIKSEDQLKYATNAIYSALGTSSVFGADILIDGDLVSDNTFVASANDGYYLTESGMGWDAINNPFTGEWNGLYTVVQRTNVVINENKLEQTTFVKSLKGEAKIIRGLAYFYLVQFFSPSIASGQNQEYGVPLVLKLSDTGAPVYQLSIPRSSIQEVYEQIIKDLEEGINEIGSIRENSKSFIGPEVGKYLLAKAYLTRGNPGDFEKAIALAEEVLNTGGDYEVLNPKNGTEYVNYFASQDPDISENQKETLFEIPQTIKSNLSVNSHPGTFYSSSGEHKSLVLRKHVYDLFTATDIRRNSMILNGPVGDTPRGVWSRKWSHTTKEGKFTANIKVFRMTELKFIQLEALAKSGRNAEAQTKLDEFTDSRKAARYTTGDLLTNILNEKRKEFFTEGHRFFDLKRNHLPINKLTNCTTCDVDANDKLFVMPINRVELRKNPLMTQYPGWDK